MDPVIAHSGLVGGVAFALSLFNVVVPVWLGVTVLTSAEERRWGVWLAGLSLLGGGIFFVFHTAFLFGSLQHLLYDIRIPESLGWVPIILLPLAWYVAMLWFAGFFEKGKRRSWKFHRMIGIVLTILIVGIGALLIYTYGITPDLYLPREESNLSGTFSTQLLYQSYSGNGWSLLFALYLLYLLVCYFSALYTLRNIERTGLVGSDTARKRARPWLIAATVVQIGIVSVVGIVLYRVVQIAEEPFLLARQLFAFQGYDLAILLLVTSALILLGEAIVRYEIFTGVVIPRQGFRRRWRGVLIMGGVLGMGASVALYLRVPGIYGVLGSIVALAVLYAFFTRRSTLERDRYLDDLRSFILRGRDAPNGERKIEEEVVRSFQLLCRDVLHTCSAWILPIGRSDSSPLPLLVFPDGVFPPSEEFIPTTLTPDLLAVGISLPERGQTEYLVIGLWSGEGLAGVLVLDEKDDGGLYTREELELARGACENFIEVVARSRMADRLTQLQGKRLSENRVNEIRVRRLLHDEVLPQLHAAMLSLQGNADRTEAMSVLAHIHRSISDLLRDFPVSVVELIQRSGFEHAFRRLLEREFNNDFRKVEWNVHKEVDEVVATLPPLTVETLYQAGREALRNAARHASGNNQLRSVELTIDISIGEPGKRLGLTIEDNGIGFQSSPLSDTSGTGQGLKLHETMMEVVGGSMKVETKEGEGTRVRLLL